MVESAFFLCLTMACAFRLWAFEPQRNLSQYARQSWETGNGFPSATISSISQGPSGYLWMGTDKGLIRFDGVEFQTLRQVNPEADAVGPVKQLIADNQSNLWILLEDTSLVRLHENVIEKIKDKAELGVTAVGTDEHRSALFSSLAFGPLSFSEGTFHLLYPSARTNRGGSADSYDDLSSRFSWASGVASHRLVEPGFPISAIADANGYLWLGASDQGLYRFAGGKLDRIWKSKLSAHITCLLPAADGRLWIGTDKGLYIWDGHDTGQKSLDPLLLRLNVRAMVTDRDGSIWLGTDKGLVRVTRSGAAADRDTEGPLHAVTALFVDRDGQVWAGGPNGLERLRKSIFASFPASASTNAGVGPVFTSEGGRIWFAPIDKGLNSMRGADQEPSPVPGLRNDTVYSLSGFGNHVWAGTQNSGLKLIHDGPHPVIEKSYTTRDGAPEDSVYVTHTNRDGSVWIATLGNGVSHFVGGRFLNYNKADGAASGRATAIEETTDGAMWFATRDGLSEFKNDRWLTFTARDGLPSDNVTSLFADPDNTLWVGTVAGLAYRKDGNFQVPSSSDPIFHEAIFGAVRDHSGRMWLSTSSHIASFMAASRPGGRMRFERVREYGTEDGLSGNLGVNRSRSMSVDPSGHVWVATNNGLAVADPTRVAGTEPTIAAKIERIDLDGAALDPKSNWSIPPGQHRLSFSYSSVNLVTPTKTRFRYKLDGFDKGWSDPVTARTAVYTNLGAGTYTFHLVSDTEDGEWGGAGTSIQFQVDQVWYRTAIFWICCVVVGFLAVWSIYRMRVSRIAQAINDRFDERLSERTRIARELHDTLLQTIQGSKFVADDALDPSIEPPRLREVVAQLSQWLERASEESRAAVNSLRSPAMYSDDLEGAFRRSLEAHEFVSKLTCLLSVSGDVRATNPIVREEICLIGLEAIRNAQRHSQGTRIKVELHYRRSLVLHVEDNGVGIEPTIIKDGKPGHFGLRGMKERVARIGGRLTFSQRPGNGTTVTLIVPGNVVYLKQQRGMGGRVFSGIRHLRTYLFERSSAE